METSCNVSLTSPKFALKHACRNGAFTLSHVFTYFQKSLPLLRQSLVTKELTIEGIRPPPANVVYSVISGTPTIQTQVRPGLATSQVRLVSPGTTVVRPNQVIQQRLVAPLRGAVQQTTRMVTAIRQPNSNVIVSSSQPPALHPVYPANRGVNIVRQQVQVRQVNPTQIRSPMTIRASAPVQGKGSVAAVKVGGAKPTVPSSFSKPGGKDKEKKSFSAAYAGDDDINDVAAMGGVNLAEETQRILGSTEFVGTQIRSCKEEFFLSVGALQQRVRLASARHGLEEPGSDVAAIVSHAVQERLKNLVEKLAIITEHRLEMVKSDPRYEVTNDVKGALTICLVTILFITLASGVCRAWREQGTSHMFIDIAKNAAEQEYNSNALSFLHSFKYVLVFTC